MDALLFADLTTTSLSDRLGGGSYTFPRLTQGDTMHVGLRLAKRVNGTPVETSRVVNELRATIGRVDARPEAGQFRLKLGADAVSIGANTTSLLPYNATAGAMQAALAALSTIEDYGAPTVETHAGSYLIRFAGATEATEIEARSNTLFPVSFVRVRGYLDNDLWVNEIRLIQAPVAFTSASARIVPAAPTITAVQDGGSSGDTDWPEIQALNIPPNFRGTYQVQRGLKKSALLSVEDGATQISAAIQSLADDASSFVVTNPSNNVVHIEFAGDMAGVNHNLLTISVFSAPEGDLTFNLALTSAELATLLRAHAEIKLPLEIEAELQDENDDEISRVTTLYRGEVTILREVAWDELGASPNIDWIRPPQPKDYTPFTTDQVITGSQHYTTTLGDGVATGFVVDHNLETESVIVSVRENSAGGAMLVHGTDYTLTIESEDSIEIIPTGSVLSAGAWAVVVSAAGPVSAFSAHTHTIAQIVGLQTFIDAIDGRVTAIEDVLPSALGIESANETGNVIAEWDLPDVAELYPPMRAIENAPLADIEQASLSKGGGLVGAVHDVQIEALTVPVPAATDAYKGRVFQNRTGATVATFGGGGGRKPVPLLANEYAACDGRTWYRVTRYDASATTTPLAVTVDYTTDIFTAAGHDFVNTNVVMLGATGADLDPLFQGREYYVRDVSGDTFKLATTSGGTAINVPSAPPGTWTIFKAPKSSFYPTDMERTLCELYVNEKQLRVSKSLFVLFGIELATLKSNTRAHWSLVVEFGTMPQDTAPGTPGANLSDVTWSATPALEQRLILSGVPSAHTFGVNVHRRMVSSVDTITAERLLYGATEAVSTPPASANFAVRVRLIRFDTENTPSSQRGFVAYRGLDVGATSGDTKNGTATIR